jgi:type I restriction enzyme S subunit
MTNLNLVKLNTLCDKITDGSHYSPKGTSKGIPMLSVKDMVENGFNYSNCKFISSDDYFDLVRGDCKPLKNDVLIAKDGSYLKHVFVIKKEIDQAVLSSIGILRPNLNKVNPDYLKYYLHTASVKETVSKKYVSGSALPRIILRNFGEIEVIYKKLDEQSKIAKVLSDLDTKIELNNKINTELEAMAKLIYDYWFVQFDFPDKNGKPYKSSGGKMVFNEELKREIPEGWENGELTDIANITMGQSPPGDSYNEEGVGEVFYQGSTDFGSRFPTNRKFTTKPSRFAKKGDILLSVRAPVGTMNIANEDCCIGRGLAALNSKDNCISYLDGVLQYMKQIFDRRNSSGTTFGSITKGDLFSLSVVKPNEDILKRFDAIAKPMFDKQNIIGLENQKLVELRDWLLPMLMNGQVRVGEVS